MLGEAASALDNTTGMAVMEEIEQLRGHKTIILIAHRLLTVKGAIAYSYWTVDA